MSDKPSAPSPHMDAMRVAHSLAFAPIFFQAARALRDLGLLEAMIQKRRPGLTTGELAERCDISPYGVTVLCEAGMSCGLVTQTDGKFRVTAAGYAFTRDEMTRVNTDFTQDVCYRGMSHLIESIREGRPAGLSELSDAPTIYEGLAKLAEPAKTSWLKFDHFYSDSAFDTALARILDGTVHHLLDVGGNTGRFTLRALSRDPELRVTVADLPGQLAMCKENVEAAGFIDRVQFHPVNLLDPEAVLPSGDIDAVWMSQFLCCFSEDEIVQLLGVARRAMSADCRLFVLDTLWDRQRNDVGTLSLHATSLYFTVLANGNSRMYDSVTFKRCIERAGFEICSETDDIGSSHTLFDCRPKA